MSIYGAVVPSSSSSTWQFARWDGSQWEPISGPFTPSSVNLIAFNDGFGAQLYELGRTSPIGGVATNGFARWLGGTSWVRPPSNHFDIGLIKSVVVFNGNIYAYGDISLSLNTFFSGIGRWDGQYWTNLGGPNLGQGEVYERSRMAVFNDGSGPAIYVTGGFNDWGGIEAHGMARWNGTAWSSVIRGVYPGSEVRGMAVGLGPHGPAMFVGGVITQAGAGNVRYVAELLACPNCYPNIDFSSADPRLNIRDFITFLNRFSAGDADANCDQSTDLPGLTVSDFICFLNRFAAGCS